MKKTKVICTIGGGSGMPVVNRALVKAGYENIYSIVTTFDSGGDTGRMRTDERGQILAFSDYWRSLISLWSDGSQRTVWEEMLRYRDGRGRNFGNIFFQFLAERAGGLNTVDELFTQLTGAVIKGQVIPVSLQPADICFETISGKKFCGEHFLDEQRMSLDKVTRINLEPKVKANIEACRAIEGAEAIIFCPGSMYGSLLVNLLLADIRKSILRSKAKKILMTNIMSTANENDSFDTNKYVDLFESYLGRQKVIDIILAADLSKLNVRLLSKVLGFYQMENSYPIRLGEGSKRLQAEDITLIESTNMRLRHSENKLARLFESLIK